MLSGDDIFTLGLMAIGGRGIISVLTNVAPRDMVALVDALKAGNLKKAQELHYRMAPLIDALFIETNPVPVKEALCLMGRITADVRLPLYPLSEKNRETLRTVMRNYGLIA